MIFENNEDYSLSKETAKEVLDKFFVRLRMNINTIEDKDIKSMVKKSIPRLVDSIRRGDLEFISDEGDYRIKLNLVDGENSIEFKIPGAIAKKAMGEKPMTDLYGRIYALMGSACGMGEGAIDKLDLVDLPIVEVLGSIFLAL